MTGSGQPPSADRVTARLAEGDHEAVVACLDRLDGADAEARKRVLRALRDRAGERAAAFDGLVPALATFLTDDDRAVRLTTARLFVTLARSEPAVPLPAVGSLADRLADAGEIDYVRARSAEALGYVALEHPGDVADPDVLAELRVGLSRDDPEVREKLAKALEHVALGDPSRLRHHVATLSDHLDDDSELVRYHLCTALVVVGCEHPERLAAVADALADRLTDGSPYVRGRAAEALGVLARSDAAVGGLPDLDRAVPADGDPPSFLADRVRFARRATDPDRSGATPDGPGTVESVRRGTADVVERITSSAEECPHCGFVLPDSGPPTCPRCGGPR